MSALRLTEREKKNIAVRKARNGRGIFAKRTFAPEETIFQVVGPRITCDEEDDLDGRVRDNTFRFDSDRYISPAGRAGDYLNHSCEPSAKIIKRGGRLFVAAARAIATGEEVTIDYSTIIAPDDVWEMSCNCGAGSCRRCVRGFSLLPRALREKYIALGMVPDYILHISAMMTAI